MISIKQEDFNNNYDLFVKLCEMTSEPLRLVSEGSPALVVMNADAFERRQKMLDLREKLLNYNDDAPLGTKGLSLEELGKYVNELEGSEAK